MTVNEKEKETASRSMATSGALLVGVVIGAALVLGILYGSGSFSIRTSPQTTTQTATQSTTQTGTTTLSSVQTGNPLYSASLNSCSKSAGSCMLRLTNSGTSDTAATACFIQDKGVYRQGTLSGPAASSMPAGGSASATCSLGAAANAAVGSSVSGTIGLANGEFAPFSGIWS